MGLQLSNFSLTTLMVVGVFLFNFNFFHILVYLTTICEVTIIFLVSFSKNNKFDKMHKLIATAESGYLFKKYVK